MTPNELETYDAMIADRDRWKERSEKLERLCPSDATGYSQSVIGYRLEDGTNKMECFFLPGRPAQRTLDMVAEHLKDGWVLTDAIRPANAIAVTPGANETPME